MTATIAQFAQTSSTIRPDCSRFDLWCSHQTIAKDATHEFLDGAAFVWPDARLYVVRTMFDELLEGGHWCPELQRLQDRLFGVAVPLP